MSDADIVATLEHIAISIGWSATAHVSTHAGTAYVTLCGRVCDTDDAAHTMHVIADTLLRRDRGPGAYSLQIIRG